MFAYKPFYVPSRAVSQLLSIPALRAPCNSANALIQAFPAATHAIIVSQLVFSNAQMGIFNESTIFEVLVTPMFHPLRMRDTSCLAVGRSKGSSSMQLLTSSAMVAGHCLGTLCMHM